MTWNIITTMKLIAIVKYDSWNDRFWAELRGGGFFAIPYDQCDGLEHGQEIYITISEGYEYCNVVQTAA